MSGLGVYRACISGELVVYGGFPCGPGQGRVSARDEDAASVYGYNPSYMWK
jgi:hypothetical protein